MYVFDLHIKINFLCIDSYISYKLKTKMVRLIKTLHLEPAEYIEKRFETPVTPVNQIN